MSTKQLFIPEKIKVGFQERNGTYTGKLAYVIYFDKKGVLRKETSWQNWRDQKIEPLEFENKPLDGFVLNKGVGGARQSYGWNARNEYIRVYDPRDFEFEISVANLLFILRECDCNKGKGLEGKFVYAWDGTELVLLPEIAEDFKVSQNYTELQGKSVKAKDLIKGATYLTRRQATLTYLGRFDYHHITCHEEYRRKKDRQSPYKQHIFWDGEYFKFFDNVQHLAELKTDVIIENYAELVDKYYKSPNGSKIVKVYTELVPDTEYWVVETNLNTFMCYETLFKEGTYGKEPSDTIQKEIIGISSRSVIEYNNGVLKQSYYREFAYKKGCRSTYWNGRYTGYNSYSLKYIDPTFLRLYAIAESGSKFDLTFGHLKEITNGED